MKTTLSAIALVFLLLVVGIVYLYVTRPHPSSLGIACTQEAKLCPDGSYVGRTGPNCEFAACPTPAHHLNEDVYPLYGGLTWGDEVATTSLSFSGYQVTSQTISGISDLSALSTPFEQYYRSKLLPLGWSEDLSLAAGGPGAQLTAYKKGGAYIVLYFRTVFHGGGVNEPVACPCDLTFSIFSGN